MRTSTYHLCRQFDASREPSSRTIMTYNIRFTLKSFNRIIEKWPGEKSPDLKHFVKNET